MNKNTLVASAAVVAGGPAALLSLEALPASLFFPPSHALIASLYSDRKPGDLQLFS